VNRHCDFLCMQIHYFIGLVSRLLRGLFAQALDIASYESMFVWSAGYVLRRLMPFGMETARHFSKTKVPTSQGSSGPLSGGADRSGQWMAITFLLPRLNIMAMKSTSDTQTF